MLLFCERNWPERSDTVQWWNVCFSGRRWRRRRERSRRRCDGHRRRPAAADHAGARIRRALGREVMRRLRGSGLGGLLLVDRVLRHLPQRGHGLAFRAVDERGGRRGGRERRRGRAHGRARRRRVHRAGRAEFRLDDRRRGRRLLLLLLLGLRRRGLGGRNGRWRRRGRVRVSCTRATGIVDLLSLFSRHRCTVRCSIIQLDAVEASAC